ALRAAQRDKSRKFKDALDEAWDQINETTKTIAGSHQKSIQRVQNQLYFGLRLKRLKPSLWNTFCWKKNLDKENYSEGRAALQSLVRDHKEAYHALSKEEREDLLEEFTEYRDTRTKGLHISTKSKVTDFTQTLKAAENELISLRCHTGAESILFTTRGLTDLPLRRITFTSEGVEKFMGSVMGIDNQDFVSKMEGFAVQGIKGVGKNYQKLISDTHASIRKLINDKLHHKITGEPGATMQWAHYFHNVVQCYQVVIKWWLDNIKFTNLSNVSSALPDLQMLEQWWNSGATEWVNIDDDELEKLHLERNEQLDNGDIIDHCRCTCSDKGRKCKQLAASQKVNTDQHKKHKSAEFIESSDEEDEPDQPPTAATSKKHKSAEFIEDSNKEDKPGPSTHSAEQANTNELPQFDTNELPQFNAHEFAAQSNLPAFDLNAPFDADITLARLNTLFGSYDFQDFSNTI
ncbi:hypothetical protein F4604DRAFT_1570639, partial [Suillus subluteus]